MASNPYMTKTEALLREGKAKLDGLRARTEKAGAEARTSAEKKLEEFEARYAEVSRRFEELRNAGNHGLAEIKIGLEKAWEKFAAEIGRAQ